LTTEIPTDVTSLQFTVSRQFTKNIGLAAACMADDLVPRLDLQNMAVYVDGDQRTAQFTFPDNPDAARIFQEWNECEAGTPGSNHTSYIFRAFGYWNQLVNIIRDAKLNPRPLLIPAGFDWTTNTKIPATALALQPGPMLGNDRLFRMVYRNGRDCGFIVKQGAVTDAYADPEKYIAEHPDAELSYVVASFYHRDHLRDLVKQIPAHHVFRDGNDIHLVPEPQPKEIPK
jgi:hypothetical protein